MCFPQWPKLCSSCHSRMLGNPTPCSKCVLRLTRHLCHNLLRRLLSGLERSKQNFRCTPLAPPPAAAVVTPIPAVPAARPRMAHLVHRASRRLPSTAIHRTPDSLACTKPPGPRMTPNLQSTVPKIICQLAWGHHRNSPHSQLLFSKAPFGCDEPPNLPNFPLLLYKDYVGGETRRTGRDSFLTAWFGIKPNGGMLFRIPNFQL